MRILKIIPLKKGIWKDNLTYFSAQDITPGSLVSIPVRNQVINGLVIDSAPAKSLKADLKASTWPIKKINRLIQTNFLGTELISAAQMSADYFAVNPGQIISSLIPRAILENGEAFKNKTVKSPETINEVLALQEPQAERLARYRSLIRESFAKKQSVFFCLPNENEIKKIYQVLGKGIENYVLVGHGGLTPKEQISVWKKALGQDHPILFVGTPLFLGLPRHDFGTIILDQENSPLYRTVSRPYLDWHYVVLQIARANHQRLILGDNSLRSETIYRLGREEISSLGNPKYRLVTNARSQLIPVTSEDNKGIVLEAITKRLLERIENALDHHEKIFIYSGRRGLAPLTLCRDCGLVMACDFCDSPLVIHQKNKKDERIFICHKCGQIIDIEDDCRRCGGQRLAILGFGIEKIIEELEANFPKAIILRLDSDTIKTNKKAEEVIRQFQKTTGGVLVGTELALQHLSEPVDNVIALGLDNLLTLPDWRASEKLFNTLLQLKELGRKNFIIQTRQPEEKIFDYVISGNLIDYYREEIEERKELGYPPFKVLIKVSLAGPLVETKKEILKLEALAKDWAPLIYPALSKNESGFPVINLLLRLPAAKWPDKNLLGLLRNLPPNFVINVDPGSVL